MKKKLYIILYGFVCAVGLMSIFSSCSDSDNQSSEGEQLTEKLQIAKQVNAIQNVLERLASIESLDGNFYQQTYTPTYGKVLDESKPFVRTMEAEDQNSAYQEFEVIVGDASLLTPTTDGYSVELKLSGELAKLANKKLFGKLIYHKGDGVTRSAYVDVEIPSLPKLQRIDFVPSKLLGNNATVVTAFKRGELVKFEGVMKDDKIRGAGYWLCVRQNSATKKGALVHVNEGFDKNFAWYLYYDSDYSWRGYFYTTFDVIADYMTFIAEKKQLVDLDKEYLRNIGESDAIAGLFPRRFLEDGYVYNGDKPAWIIQDSYESTYDGSAGRHWKCCKHFYLDAKSSGKGEYHEWWYHTPGDWSDQQNKYYFYTINVLYFEDKMPEGTSFVYDPSNDYN